MTGTREGGLKARQTNIEKYGRDFYKRIGQQGGHNGHTGGFAANPELAKIAGAKGGRKSKRGPSKDPVLAKKLREERKIRELKKAEQDERIKSFWKKLYEKTHF